MKKLIAILSLACFLSPLIASAALYKSSDGKVWADWNGKRRWIRTLEIFNSYGYKWSDVKDIADLSLSKKPINNLVRIKDKPEVYALSDSGYKRHIHNPDIFNSYNLSWDDVADINETELANYPDCNLIKEADNEKVYKLDGNTLYPIKDLATFNYYGFSWSALQIINSEDLAIYTMGSELAYTAPAGSPSPSPSWSPTPTPTPTPSPSPSPSSSPTPTTIPTTTPSPSSSPIPVKELKISVSAPMVDLNGRYYEIEVRYLENYQRVTSNGITISSNDNGVFTGSPYSEEYPPCTGGVPFNARGSEGNPITCPTRPNGSDGKPAAKFNFRPSSTDNVTITATVNGATSTITVYGQIFTPNLNVPASLDITTQPLSSYESVYSGKTGVILARYKVIPRNQSVVIQRLKVSINHPEYLNNLYLYSGAYFIFSSYGSPKSSNILRGSINIIQDSEGDIAIKGDISSNAPVGTEIIVNVEGSDVKMSDMNYESYFTEPMTGLNRGILSWPNNNGLTLVSR